MNSPSATKSPTFKNLKLGQKHSPVELKEHLRKNYKDKVKNCRHLLINKFRGTVQENDIRNTLTEIYKSLFDLSENNVTDDEEHELWEVVKKELVQEELQWWLKEYERSNFENVDWSYIEQDNSVICPVCQKTNFKLQNEMLKCSTCNINIKTSKSLQEIKVSVLNCIEKHGLGCSYEAHFSLVTELNESHIYLICERCMDMHVVV